MTLPILLFAANGLVELVNFGIGGIFWDPENVYTTTEYEPWTIYAIMDLWIIL